ncbi:pilin N-terminal domain-containing protein [Helcococcus ovis]|uniref:pilin N-terminal domain-containing protein n=1 Tax=Helcococcus ovis TaxID=72026 RepID=UPI0038BC40A4
MKKRIISAFLAFIMVFAMVVPGFVGAAEVEEKAIKTKSVTLHKLLISKEDLEQWDKKEPKGYDGTQNFEKFKTLVQGKELKEIKGVYFAWQYKDQDQTWQYVKGTKEGATLTSEGKLQIARSIDEAFAGLTEDNGIKFNTEKLPQDKATEYRIVEVAEKTIYKGTQEEELAGSKAVPVVITLPLVNEKGVVADAHVYPKNTEEKPQIDKNFVSNNDLKVVEDKQSLVKSGAQYGNSQKEKATVQAELGKKVPYEVKTKINKGSRYANLAWKDTMTNGLTFNKEGNINGVKLVTNPNLNLEATKDYTVTSDDRGFTLKLTTEGFKKLNTKTHPEDEKTKAEDVEFTLTYSATVNRNAIIDVPETNDIRLEYGNKPKKEVKPTDVTPKEGKLEVKKTWADGEVQSDDIKVTYTLTNSKGKSYAVSLDKNTKNKTFELGNGAKFEVKGQAFNGEFTALIQEGDTKWTLSERVAGYNEEIKAEDTAGSATITNTKDKENPIPLNPTEPKVVYYGKRFVKVDYTTGERLQGAEFIVKNESGKYLALKSVVEKEQQVLAQAKKAYEEAIAAWNKSVQENADKRDEEIKIQINNKDVTGKKEVQEAINKLKEAYDQAFKNAANEYEWVDRKEGNEDKLVKLISDKQGKFEITGLESGTYKLEEIKSPAGYAVKSDEDFIVGPNTYKSHADGVKYKSDKSVNEEKGSNEAQRVNNKKISIPQTGGIGTVIFTVAGLIIMGAAIYALKKNNQEVDA